MGDNMTADEWRQIDEALDKKLEKQQENIITRVKSMLFGETGNNGINGKCEKNTKDIVELDRRIDVIEKQKPVEQPAKTDIKLESKKLIIDLWKAIIIALLVFFGTGTGAFIVGKIWP